jgi:Na+-transporting NADH:ubiquinone oxidoreductase subunit NqrC
MIVKQFFSERLFCNYIFETIFYRAMLAMILTIVVSMLVYIFWFIKSEFQRVLDRIDQSTLGIARMQRELTQSTVKQLHDSLQESFGRLEDDDNFDEEEDDDDEENNEDDDLEEVDETEEVEEVEEVEEDDEANEPTPMATVQEETPEPTDQVVEAMEKEIESAIIELDTAVDAPKKRGRKSKK